MSGWDGRRDLLSHTVARAVPSACWSLTSEFGMGSGRSSAITSPTKLVRFGATTLTQTGLRFVLPAPAKGCSGMEGRRFVRSMLASDFAEGSVPVKAVRAISTRWLNASPHVHLAPIDRVVFPDPSGSAHLEGGFPLRCFQRLSRPHVATRQCRWRDNRNTRGASIPVLSY